MNFILKFYFQISIVRKLKLDFQNFMKMNYLQTYFQAHMYTVTNFNQTPGLILNNFFLMLEKPIAQWGNLLAQPRKDFLFPSWNFPPKSAIQKIYGKHSPR
jgi:hypothetical protein